MLSHFSHTSQNQNMASSSSSLISQEPTSAKLIAKAAKTAFEASQLIPSSERVSALHEIKKELENAKEKILEANKRDLEVRLPYDSLPQVTCSFVLVSRPGSAK